MVDNSLKLKFHTHTHIWFNVWGLCLLVFHVVLMQSLGGSVANEFHACYANYFTLHENKFSFSSHPSHQHRHMTPVDGKMGFHSTQCSSSKLWGRVMCLWIKCSGISPLQDYVWLPFPHSISAPDQTHTNTNIFLTGFSISQRIEHFINISDTVNGDPFNRRNKQINL